MATPAAAGPWSARAQHGGPTSALAARALERHDPDEGQRLARVAVDILRPVPVGKITVRTRTVRPGRRVALIEAVLEADGQEVMQVRGWRIARPSGRGPSTPAGPPPPPIPPEQPPPVFPGAHMAGYLEAIEWRYVFAGGGFSVPGPASVWARPKIPLLPGEEPSPMCRALLLADWAAALNLGPRPGEIARLITLLLAKIDHTATCSAQTPWVMPGIMIRKPGHPVTGDTARRRRPTGLLS